MIDSTGGSVRGAFAAINSPYIRTWVYLLVIVTCVYWFIVAGIYMFPTVNPLIFSLVAMILLYFLSNQKALVLLF